MTPKLITPTTTQRRRNAAALQGYLKRYSPTGFQMGSDELRAAAQQIQHELCGSEDALELVRQAWVDLIEMGLVSVDLFPNGRYTWRLADVPRGSGHLGSSAPGWEDCP